MTKQYALPLGWDRSDSRRSLVIGGSNASAIERLSSSDSWAGHAAILTGPPRSGLSLAAQLFAESGNGEVIDDAERRTDDDLFHRWNLAREEGRKLLLVSHLPPGEWDVSLPDLRSRLASAELLTFEDPGDDMVRPLLELHFAQHGTSASDDALAYAEKRVERSHVAIEELAAEANRLSLSERKPVTLAILRELLSDRERQSDLDL